MVKNQIDTEEKILDAAKEVFQQKGMSGARMQEIADKAGINKALLHYYYRTKEKLFENVLSGAFKLIVPRIQEMIETDAPVFDKIRFFVDKYISLIINHPYLPGFVINELSKNPEMLSNLFARNIGEKRFHLLAKFEAQLKNEAEEGIIHYIDAKSLLTNMLALSIFPVIARPILSTVLFDDDQKEYKEFLKRRKTEVADFLINAIKVK